MQTTATTAQTVGRRYGQSWHMDTIDVWNVVLVVGLGLTVVATVFVNLYAKRNAIETDRRIVEAHAQANAAALETEQIKKQNLDLQLTVERERTARLQLEKQVSETANTATAAIKKADATNEKIRPRTLTDAQRKAFAQAAGTIPKGRSTSSP